MQLVVEYPSSLPDVLQETPEQFEQEARMAMVVKLFELKRISSGIAAEVDENLLKLRPVANHRAAALEVEMEFDFGRQQAFEQCPGFACFEAQVERFQFGATTAPEDQDLLHEVTCALACVDDAVDVRRRALVTILAQQVRVPEYRYQQVVEVMRDTARQRTERRQLLGLPEPGFESLLFGHISPRGNVAIEFRHLEAGAFFPAVEEEMPHVWGHGLTADYPDPAYFLNETEEVSPARGHSS